MNKKLYIHMGLAKTGTSFLQSVFAINESNYKKYGLIYPDISGCNVHATQGKTTSGNGINIAIKLIPLLQEQYKLNFDETLIFKTLDPNFDYLISSEWFSYVNPESIKNIGELISNTHDIHLIYFYRSIPDLVVSTFLQGLKTGVYKENLEDNLDEVFFSIKTGILNLVKLCEMDFHFSVFNYDCTENLVSVIDKLLFGKNVSVFPQNFIVNKSPDLHQMKILDLINKLGITDFSLNMDYINKYSDKERGILKPSKLLAKQIEEKFRDQINSLNRLSSPDHQYVSFISSYEDIPETSALEIKKDSAIEINQDDISHIKNLILFNFKNKII